MYTFLLYYELTPHTYIHTHTQYTHTHTHTCNRIHAYIHLANVGVGEREGRVHSQIVRDRHFHLAHGIGR